MDEVLAEDCIQEWPQSGEVIRGKHNILAIMKDYPGLPNVTVRSIRCAGRFATAEIDLDYDGDRYCGVTILEFDNGKVVREIDYFAEPFAAPDWRARWVERT